MKPKLNIIGTWECTSIESWNNKDVIIDTKKNSYLSEIMFYDNNNFTRTTNNEVFNGTYSFKKSNKLILSEINNADSNIETFTIRWPKNTIDPHPETTVIDFVLFDEMEVRKKNGTIITDLVICLYTRK